MTMKRTTKSRLGTTLAGAVLVSGLAISTSASALPVSILSYDMLNGNNGKYDYFDEAYTGGGGNVENGLLTGGLGKLTDGLHATTRFDVDEWLYDPGHYVGWTEEEVATPTITFNLAPGSITNSVTIWVDDADGIGGVHAPASVTINGDTYSFVDPTPLVDLPRPPLCEDLAPCTAIESFFDQTMPFSNTFFGTWATDTLVLEFEYEGNYIMVSEVDLQHTTVTVNPTPIDPPPQPGPIDPPPQQGPIAVPEPGTLAIFGIGLAGLGFARRRRVA